jgi:hypothetical protein
MSWLGFFKKQKKVFSTHIIEDIISCALVYRYAVQWGVVASFACKKASQNSIQRVSFGNAGEQYTISYVSQPRKRRIHAERRRAAHHVHAREGFLFLALNFVPVLFIRCSSVHVSLSENMSTAAATLLHCPWSWWGKKRVYVCIGQGSTYSLVCVCVCVCMLVWYTPAYADVADVWRWWRGRGKCILVYTYVTEPKQSHVGSTWHSQVFSLSMHAGGVCAEYMGIVLQIAITHTRTPRGRAVAERSASLLMFVWRTLRSTNRVVFNTITSSLHYEFTHLKICYCSLSFLVSTDRVTISNPRSLFSSETRVDPGIRSWK